MGSLQEGFFYQAEDGIRDLTVTGVQTCALPIFVQDEDARLLRVEVEQPRQLVALTAHVLPDLDRKSTRLNSSHSQISYAVFCLKKKKKHYNTMITSTTTSTQR